MMLAYGAYGGDHRIAGPESVTADQLAAGVAAGLGRPVVYCPRPLDEFERDVDAAMGAGTGRRVASQANAMRSRPFEARPGLEDFQPTHIGQWVRRHAKEFHQADRLAATGNS
jgi:hypothetical protein